MLRNTLSRDYRNIKKQTNLTAALFSGATNLNITSHKSSSPSPRIAEPYAGFRLCETALGYDFAHRPFEDKMKKARKDKDQFQKEMYGLRGSPKRSQDRHVNKLFDHSRRNTRNLGMCDGCDVNYSMREQVMTVGKVPRGDYRGLDPDVAYGREYKAMNIDRDSVQERHIARTIEQDRGRTTSSYEGENHFHNKFRKQPRKLSHLSSFMEESQFGQGGRSICQAITSIGIRKLRRETFLQSYRRKTLVATRIVGNRRCLISRQVEKQPRSTILRGRPIHSSKTNWTRRPKTWKNAHLLELETPKQRTPGWDLKWSITIKNCCQTRRAMQALNSRCRMEHAITYSTQMILWCRNVWAPLAKRMQPKTSTYSRAWSKEAVQVKETAHPESKRQTTARSR